LHAPLHGLLDRGIHGDACVIPEGPHLELSLAGRGLVIFRVWFRRSGAPVHELLAGDVAPANPLMAAQAFLEGLARASQGWTVAHPLAGAESYFVGAVRGGDLYNRIPTVAEVWGTRRYPTGRTADEVTAELEGLAEAAAARVGVDADVSISRSGQPFAIAPDERIVGVVDDAHERVTGRRLRRAGLPYTGDVSHFVNLAGVPAIYHGTDQATAHADHESVAIDDLVRCARVILATATSFLGVA
jgi:acetylornithine deacetylase/succinyl-diaminopimelate desuccinylase-like protein